MNFKHEDFPTTERSWFIDLGMVGKRVGSPGRVAYLAGTRWLVWLIVELVKDYSGKVKAAARHT